MMHMRFALIFAIAPFATSCGSGAPNVSESAVEDVDLTSTSDTSGKMESQAGPPESAREEPLGNLLTGPQANAVRSAQQYLSMSGFSRAGLIEQLSSEYGDGYSVTDATAAVDSLNVDWNDNAVKSARQYLDMTGFSCNGLVEQLSSNAGDKYTTSQATYGAQQAGAC